MERHSRGRLSIGGATWGGLLGIPLGAIVGTIYGVIAGNTACGLDGALIGGLASTAAGAIWGVILGFGDSPSEARPPRQRGEETEEDVATPFHGTEARSFHIR